MIYGHIGEKEQWAVLAGHPAWKAAFDWLQSLDEETPERKVPLMGDDMFGIVMGYETLPGDTCRFESHREFVDLQYTISGGEKIGWSRAADLASDGPFDAEKDLQFYIFRNPESLLHMGPGHFAVFYPTDAHAPKIADSRNREVFKAVVKIRRSLLTDSKGG